VRRERGGATKRKKRSRASPSPRAVRARPWAPPLPPRAAAARREGRMGACVSRGGRAVVAPPLPSPPPPRSPPPPQPRVDRQRATDGPPGAAASPPPPAEPPAPALPPAKPAPLTLPPPVPGPSRLVVEAPASGRGPARPLPLPPLGADPLLALGDGHGVAAPSSSAPSFAPITWGDGDHRGALGRGERAPGRERAAPGPVLAWPRAVRSKLRSVAAGGFSTAVIDGAGAVWSWGAAPAGGRAVGATPAPRRLLLPAAATAVALGASHGVALLQDGTVAGWGDAVAGALGGGVGASAGSRSPARVPGVAGATALTCGAWHSAALVGGGLVVWGGVGVRRPRTRPFAPAAAFAPPALLPRLFPPCGAPFVSLAAGDGFTVALDADGGVWHARPAPAAPPARVALPADPAAGVSAPAAVAVAASAAGGFALDASGRVCAWPAVAPAAGPLTASLFVPLVGVRVAAIAGGGGSLVAVLAAPAAPRPHPADGGRARWWGAAATVAAPTAALPPPIKAAGWRGAALSPLLPQRSVSESGSGRIAAARKPPGRRSTVEGVAGRRAAGGG